MSYQIENIFDSELSQEDFAACVEAILDEDTSAELRIAKVRMFLVVTIKDKSTSDLQEAVFQLMEALKYAES